MKILHYVAFALTVVGALNWGLVGLGWILGNGENWNLVHMLVGSSMELEGTVYVLVGLSAVWIVLGHKKMCKMCM